LEANQRSCKSCKQLRLHGSRGSQHLAVLSALGDAFPERVRRHHDHQPGVSDGAVQRVCRNDCHPGSRHGRSDLDLQRLGTRLLGLGVRLHRPRPRLLPAVCHPGVVFFMLPKIHDATTFSVLFAIIGLCYGGGFGTMPSFTADFFGPKFMGGIYGWILLAWGAAAIPSPIMIAHRHQATGQFSSSVYVIAVVMLCSLVLPLVARRPKREAVAVPARQPVAV